MILQALHNLHDRLQQDPKYDIAPDGFSFQQISLVIVLNPDGSLHEIEDIRQPIGKAFRPQRKLVFGGAKPPGSGLNPCLLWDNPGYLLGFPGPDADDRKTERALKAFEASAEHHLSFESEINHPAFSAVCRFMESWKPSYGADHPILQDVTTGFCLFQIRGTTHYIHEEPAIKEWWRSRSAALAADNTGPEGFCLISGKKAPIASLHEPKIKGVKDAQGAGALIVSFNTNAYESFRKKSGENAPVSINAAARYCNSLNALLSAPEHRLQIGDATTVFWTDVPTTTESAFSIYFSSAFEEETKEDAQKGQLLKSLQDTLRSIQKGGEPDQTFSGETKNTFHILGLTGQAGGRIGIRFWHQSSIGELLQNLAKHHEDLRIQPEWGPNAKNPDPEFPQVWQLLRQTARESKDVPPTLGGALMRAILTGTNYPQLLANSILSRIRADRSINYFRAAILKAWLTRNHKHQIPMTYDSSKPETAYRLGALFALLEKTQTDALGNINATIRDRYYSSASATPASVFPRLLRTYQHHLSKAGSQNRGLQINREREVQAILAEPKPIQDFPTHLNLRDQGLFAIGYYHKSRDLWAKRSKNEPDEPDSETQVPTSSL